jgi:hypothetical protein
MRVGIQENRQSGSNLFAFGHSQCVPHDPTL